MKASLAFFIFYTFIKPKFIKKNKFLGFIINTLVPINNFKL